MTLEPLPGAEGRPELLWRLVPADGGTALQGEALSIAAVPSGGHVIGGLADASDRIELFALQLDAAHCAVASWRQPLTSAGAEITSLLALPDGGVVVGGRTAGSGGTGDEEAWLARYRRDGRLLWTLVQGEFLYVSGLFDTPSREVVQALALLPDGRLAAAGRADVNGALYSNWLLLLEPDGRAPLRIDLPRDDPRLVGNIAALAQADDGRLALAGTLDAEGDKADAWLLVLAQDGTLLWDRRYRTPGRQRVADLAWIGEELLLVGRQGDEPEGDGWALLVGAEGEPLGDALLRHGAARSEDLHAVAALRAGSVAVGRSDSGPAGGGWLLRLDRELQLGDALALPSGSLAAVAPLAGGGLLAAGRDAGGAPLLLLVPD